MKTKATFLLVFIFATFVTNSQVSFQWAKSMGGPFDDVGNSVAVDGAGNVYTTGTFSGTADFDPGPGVYNLTAGAQDAFISKVDATGAFVWARQFGVSSSAYGMSIAIDALGNIYTTGWFVGTADFDPGAAIYNLTSFGSDDIFVSKLNGSGNFVWAKQLGGPNTDGAFSITLDGSGNVYTTGGFSGTADFDPGAGVYNMTAIGAGTDDVFISKLDASGNFLWAKSFGGTSGSGQGYSIAIDASNNVYTTGLYQGTTDFDPGASVYNLTSAGGWDIFVSKLDVSGNFLWASGMGGPATNADVGFSIAVDASGNVYTTGYFNGTADFDPGPGVFNLTVNGLSNEDVFVSKLNSFGAFVWAKQLGGPNVDRAYSIVLDASGSVYTTGVFDGPSDFDPGAGVYNLTSVGDDIFVSKLDATGTFVWANSMGGGGTDQGESIEVDAAGNIYITGFFQSAGADFDPGPGIYNLSTVGGSDVFIVKLSNVVGIKENNFIYNVINIYPNPSHGLFKLYKEKGNTEGNSIETKIMNVMGEEIIKVKLEEEVEEFDITRLNNGIYFLQVFQNDKLLASEKVIKE